MYQGRTSRLSLSVARVGKCTASIVWCGGRVGALWTSMVSRSVTWAAESFQRYSALLGAAFPRLPGPLGEWDLIHPSMRVTRLMFPPAPHLTGARRGTRQPVHYLRPVAILKGISSINLGSHSVERTVASDIAGPLEKNFRSACPGRALS